jgi:hypothetical protein
MIVAHELLQRPTESWLARPGSTTPFMLIASVNEDGL